MCMSLCGDTTGETLESSSDSEGCSGSKRDKDKDNLLAVPSWLATILKHSNDLSNMGAISSVGSNDVGLTTNFCRTLSQPCSTCVYNMDILFIPASARVPTAVVVAFSEPCTIAGLPGPRHPEKREHIQFDW